MSHRLTHVTIPFILIIGMWSESSTYPATANTFPTSLVDAAFERTQQTVQYDGSYRTIPYPLGDVPDDRGVCTDVVIRSYRSVGIDLQELVHKDMRNDFSVYPNNWGLRKPDPNIDHRRVPNLRTFFTRYGQVLPRTLSRLDYHPGDIVTWMLPGNLPHIGIVTDRLAPGNKQPMVVHNIGHGPQLEDILFKYEMTGHYRYHPSP